MIFSIEHNANWEYIRTRKHKLIKKNNQAENSKWIPHSYSTRDKVMLKIGTANKYETPYSGPHIITEIGTNGTVRLQMGAVNDTVNIRRIDPFTDSPASIHGGDAVCVEPEPREHWSEQQGQENIPLLEHTRQKYIVQERSTSTIQSCK